MVTVSQQCLEIKTKQEQKFDKEVSAKPHIVQD